MKFLIQAMTRHFFSYDQQSLGNTDLHLAEILRRMVVLEEIFKVTFRSAWYNVTIGVFCKYACSPTYFLMKIELDTLVSVLTSSRNRWEWMCFKNVQSMNWQYGREAFCSFPSSLLGVFLYTTCVLCYVSFEGPLIHVFPFAYRNKIDSGEKCLTLSYNVRTIWS